MSIRILIVGSKFNESKEKAVQAMIRNKRVGQHCNRSPYTERLGAEADVQSPSTHRLEYTCEHTHKCNWHTHPDTETHTYTYTRSHLPIPPPSKPFLSQAKRQHCLSPRFIAIKNAKRILHSIPGAIKHSSFTVSFHCLKCFEASTSEPPRKSKGISGGRI